MQACIVACSAAESPTLARMHMGALSPAALLLLMQSREPATQEICECSLSASVVALALQYCVSCRATHCLLLLLSAVTADARVYKQFAFSSKAAGGQSALLSMLYLSGKPVG